MKTPVIVVCYLGRKGGGALDAYEFTKALIDNDNHVVAIISAYIENKELWKSLKLDDLIEIETYTNKISFIKNTVLFNFGPKKIIESRVKQFEVRAVYCPMVSFWTGFIFSIFTNKKKVISIHDPIAHSGSSKLIDRYYHKLYRMADTVVVHSKKFVDLIQNEYKDVVYLPLGNHDFYKNLPDKQRIVSYDIDKVNFLFFGRITPYKGLDILSKAYKTLCDKYADSIALTVIGNGDFSCYESEYSTLPNTTIINRWVADGEVESIFKGKNLVCVCPYKDATQSGVILVAYSYDVPVIASNSGGVEEQVIDGKTGFLVKPGSVESLAAAMEIFVKNRTVFTSMKSEINNFLKLVSWEESAKKLTEHLDAKE